MSNLKLPVVDKGILVYIQERVSWVIVNNRKLYLSYTFELTAIIWHRKHTGESQRAYLRQANGLLTDAKREGTKDEVNCLPHSNRGGRCSELLDLWRRWVRLTWACPRYPSASNDHNFGKYFKLRITKDICSISFALLYIMEWIVTVL